MDEELRNFFLENLGKMNSSWNKDQKSAELAQWALEAGYGDLPEPYMGPDPEKIKQWDRDVESAYSFLMGEARYVLETAPQT